jgi:hypothetical protein
MTVHRLGQMSETVRDLARSVPPAYREVRVMLPVPMITALEEHIVNRVHEGELPPGLTLEGEFEAHLALAIRSMIDHWPDLGPYATPPAHRTGPAASLPLDETEAGA